MSNLNVLVVGASIAGPTVAYWLARAGANVTVIERFEGGPRPGGQNVDIRSVGVTIMRKMATMESLVRSKLYKDLEGLSFVSANGDPIAVMRSTGNPDQQSLISEYEIFRGDLSQILYDMTKDHPSVRYVFGEQILGLSSQQRNETGASITVEFANGKLPKSEFDLVVACDGATSRTRAIGLGCGVRDYIRPVNSWVAYFTIPTDLLQSKIAQGFSAPGGRTVILAPDPKGGTRAALWANLPRNDENATLPFQDAQKQGNEALKQYVARYFSAVGWKTSTILEHLESSEDFYASEIVQVKSPCLSNGFVLVGDAGYGPGPTGFGTSLAMAGAYILAGEIKTHPGDIDAALRSYEERMGPLITEMQKIPPGVPAVMAPQTASGIWLRNTIFVLVVWCMNTFGKYFSWLTTFWSSSFGGDKYNLPDYGWSTQDEK